MTLSQEEIDARISRLLDKLEHADLNFNQSQRLWGEIEKLQQMQPA